MIINDEIYSILQENKIRKNDAITYLLSLYYDCVPEYIPLYIQTKVAAAGIFHTDTKGGINWCIPLFQGQVAGPFDWVVTDYLECFKHYEKHRLHKRECVSRMKKLFSRHPSIRREEVIGATKMYIQKCIRSGTKAQYVINPHYFIRKGSGSDKTQTLLGYIDLYREYTNDFSDTDQPISKTISMQ